MVMAPNAASILVPDATAAHRPSKSMLTISKSRPRSSAMSSASSRSKPLYSPSSIYSKGSYSADVPMVNVPSSTNV